jgi:hypothetical protein
VYIVGSKVFFFFLPPDEDSFPYNAGSVVGTFKCVMFQVRSCVTEALNPKTLSRVSEWGVIIWLPFKPVTLSYPVVRTIYRPHEYRKPRVINLWLRQQIIFHLVCLLY